MKKWTEAETAILKERFSTSTIDELAALFPDRTYDAVRAKARTLSVHRFKPVLLWEKEVLLTLGPRISFEELRLLLPRRSKEAVYELAEMLKITLFEEAL